MPPVSAVGGQGYSGRVRALAVIAALFALLVAGCGSESGDEATPTTTTTTESARSEGGPMAPAIEGTTLDGERLSLADFRGRPVLVNVWAAW
jgi:cytochrome oxidase Cu insertion factor (SCO1/SenC/PrrC family)